MAKARGKHALLLFFLFGAAPLAALVWFFVQPESTRTEILAKIPEGAGGRAARAGIAFAVLIGLAVVALPAFHGASAALRGFLDRQRAAPLARRVLLAPVEFVVGLVWLVVQIVFAVDVVLIVVASLAVLLATARILNPDVLPHVAPWL